MPQPKRKIDAETRARLQAELRRDIAQRQQGYRARALKLLPHVCARCGREFSGSRLKELTVHHRDHDHKNNPPDGSNWELLCIYCHDHEHEKHRVAGHAYGTEEERVPTSTFTPFEGLDALIVPQDEAQETDD